jgi:potassium-transporting ATPase KdpC subunit
MKEQIRITAVALLLMTVILGIVYPLFICGVGHALFPIRAGGSLIKDASGHVIGSKIIGQSFTRPIYFHPRPSMAGGGYDAMASNGSNLGPTSKKLMEMLQERIAAYRAENNLPPDLPLPVDAVTASGSGLDPHISPENADLQSTRVATARNMPLSQVKECIRKATAGRWLGIFGEIHVNVLELNMLLDATQAPSK